MELETARGRGTRLQLIAPLRDPYAERPQGDVDSASTEVALPVGGLSAEVSQVGGGPIRVLLADDHPGVRKALATLLCDAGHRDRGRGL
jgi:hypothetical protein